MVGSRTALALLCALCLNACGDPPTPADAGDDGGSGMDAGPQVTLCAAHEHCDDGIFCNGVEECAPGDAAADAQGCVSAPEPPCMPSQTCDEEALRCLTECDTDPDADLDGHSSIACGGDDCDDADPDRFPGNAEVCDTEAHDEDCRSDTYGFQDLDADGYVDASCCNVNDAGEMICGDDCNDMRAVSHPGRTEACDTFDNDCDALVDEGALRTFYPDADDDGFGDATGAAVMACMPPPDHVENSDDCDDTNAAAHSTSGPEICDSADNDCDGLVDEGTTEVTWYRDLDGDLFGDADDPAPVTSCLPVANHVPNSGDCDDALGSVNPGASEGCNSIDDDCDGVVDEGVGTTYYLDADGDTYGTPATTMVACSAPSGYVAMTGDCDDATATTHPGATELCNNVDDNCSEGGGAITSEDEDGDGHAAATAACTGGYPKNDCRDDHPDIFAGNSAYYAEPISCMLSTGGYVQCDWDYDCSGSAEREVAEPCVSSGTNQCSGGGPDYTGSPDCGTQVEYRGCGFNHAIGRCFRIAAGELQPLRCH